MLTIPDDKGNVKQNKIEISPHSNQNDCQIIVNADEDMRKKEL
jgi:hypothetical protein